MTKNDHHGGPRIAKNAKNSILENLKNQKMAPPKSFFEGLIFQQILGCKKIGKKGGQGCQKGLWNHRPFVNSTKFWGPGPPLSIKDTKKTKKSKLVGNSGSNTPLGRRISSPSFFS